MAKLRWVRLVHKCPTDSPEKRVDDRGRVAEGAHLASADGRLAGERDVSQVALVVEVGEVAHLGALGQHGVVDHDLPVLEGFRLHQAARVLRGCRRHAKCAPR